MTDNSPQLNFEAAMEQLQAVVQKLEGGNLPLEEALKQFEEGVRLTRACQEQLFAAEQRVEILMKADANGNIDLQPFNPQRT